MKFVFRKTKKKTSVGTWQEKRKKHAQLNVKQKPYQEVSKEGQLRYKNLKKKTIL